MRWVGIDGASWVNGRGYGGLVRPAASRRVLSIDEQSAEDARSPELAGWRRRGRA